MPHISAYIVKEFTFERFSKKLDSNKGHNDSVCVSVSALNCEPDDIEDIPCVGSAMSKKWITKFKSTEENVDTM